MSWYVHPAHLYISKIIKLIFFGVKLGSVERVLVAFRNRDKFFPVAVLRNRYDLIFAPQYLIWIIGLPGEGVFVIIV